MDLSFSEEQQDLAGLARRVFEDQVTVERLREVEAGTDVFDRETWAQLGRTGLLGIALPAEVGGGGYGTVEQSLVLEQQGRVTAYVPTVASIVMAAAPIARFGTAAQREAWAAPAATGDVILSAALVEPLDAQPTTVSGGRLTGVKTCVPYAHLAQRILVEAGGGLHLVDPAGEGVTLQRQVSTNREVEALLTLDGAPAELVTDDPGALPWLLLRAELAHCALQLGVCAKATEMTAEYTKTREQFDRPLAHFQAVGQRAADAYIATEGIRLTLWQAAWKLDEGLDATTEVEVAKFWAAESGHTVAHAAVHLHGGVGIDLDSPVHRYFNAAKKHEFALGSAHRQLLRIGARLAG